MKNPVAKYARTFNKVIVYKDRKKLAKAGYQPITLDNLATGHADAVKWGPFVQADIRDADKAQPVIQIGRMKIAAKGSRHSGRVDTARVDRDRFLIV